MASCRLLWLSLLLPLVDTSSFALLLLWVVEAVVKSGKAFDDDDDDDDDGIGDSSGKLCRPEVATVDDEGDEIASSDEDSDDETSDGNEFFFLTIKWASANDACNRTSMRSGIFSIADSLSSELILLMFASKSSCVRIGIMSLPSFVIHA